MKTTMKTRLTKGILAAAMALTTVFGTMQYAKTDLTAHALCGHHCYHNTVYSKWQTTQVIEEDWIGVFTYRIISLQVRNEYDECSSCKLQTFRREHCRKLYTYFNPWHMMFSDNRSSIWEEEEILY